MIDDIQNQRKIFRLLKRIFKSVKKLIKLLGKR